MAASVELLRLPHASPLPGHGLLGIKMFYKAAAAATTAGDPIVQFATAQFDPRPVLASYENAFAFLSGVLVHHFGLDPAQLHRELTHRLVQGALNSASSLPDAGAGVFVSVDLETVYFDDDEEDDDDEEEDDDSGGPVGLSESDVLKLKSEKWEGGSCKELCAVCLAEFVEGEGIIRLAPSCSHIFHKDCIVVWLRRNQTCPMCRRVVVVGSNLGDDESSSAVSPSIDVTMPLLPHLLYSRPSPSFDPTSLLPHNLHVEALLCLW